VEIPDGFGDVSFGGIEIEIVIEIGIGIEQ